MKIPDPYGYVQMIGDDSCIIQGFRSYISDVPVYSKKQVETLLQELADKMYKAYEDADADSRDTSDFNIARNKGFKADGILHATIIAKQAVIEFKES